MTLQPALIGVFLGAVLALAAGWMLYRRTTTSRIQSEQIDQLTERVLGLELERDQLREAVARDLAEATRLAEVRRDLVANVSHELKTPLTAIRGYAETLEDGALERPEFARRFTRRILDQCQRLEALLRDLLALSRLEGAQPQNREAVDLLDLAKRTVATLEPRARQAGIELTIACEAPPPILHGDRHELERMLINLIENAIKYNRPDGSVVIALASDEHHLVLEVRDHGIGIPDDAQDRIFERFYRIDKGRARDQGGTGLGLAIVKHVVQGHGGRIEVDSRLGEGSTFRVRLPVTDA